MLARAGSTRRRPAVRHARSGLLRAAGRAAAAAAVFAARAQLLGQAQRHARVLRRLRRCPRTATSPSTTRCSRRSGARSRTSPAPRSRRSSPASTAARRPTTRCRSAGLALAYARLAGERDDAVYGPAPRILADAMTAHPEMVSGEGRNDLALHARRPRRLGDQDRRRGVSRRSASAAGAGASRSRSSTAPSAGLHPATVAVLDQLGAARRRAARRARAVARADGAQLPRHRDRPRAAGGCPGRRPAAAEPRRRGAALRGAVNFPPFRRSVHASVRSAETSGSDAASVGPDPVVTPAVAAPAVRRAKQRMIQGKPVNG